MKKRHVILPILICSTLFLTSCDEINVSGLASILDNLSEVSTSISEVVESTESESVVDSSTSVVTSQVSQTAKEDDNLTYKVVGSQATVTGVVDNSVKEIIVPEYIEGYFVAEIELRAFEQCTYLESITLPFVGENYDMESNTHLSYIFGGMLFADNITSIPYSLTTVHVTGDTDIGDYAFFSCVYLTTITIPDTVTSLGLGSFGGCTNLESIVIPDSVTSIGDYAFMGSASITSIVIPDKVAAIGPGTFDRCYDLTSITLPNGMTSIGEGAFYRCYHLTSITLPDNLETLGETAFYGCTILTTIKIPDKVTVIEETVFSGCFGLISVIIPGSVTNIGLSAFYGCSSLEKIFYTGNTASWDLITIAEGNTQLSSATVYSYAETEPTETGNYWHYVDGSIVIW